MSEAQQSAGEYFVRARGKITGPFSVKQLKTLHEQGRLSPSFEISTDRQDWKPAKTLTNVFGGGGRKKQNRSKSAEGGRQSDPQQQTVPTDDGSWYYNVNGQQVGPITFAELRSVAANNQLQPTDFVWRAGDPEWQPASQVASLFQPAGGGGRSSTVESPSAPSTTMSTAAQRFQDVSSGLLWTAIFREFRKRFTIEFLEETAVILMRCGGFAMIVAMIVVPAFMGYIAIKIDSIEFLLMAAGAFFALGILKYIAQRMASAVHDLVQSSPSRLASPAFLDSAALLFLASGIAAAVNWTIAAIQSDNFTLIVPALQVLIICGYAACISLQPKWLNIECPSDATGGEEGVGILSFFVKVPLRFAAVNFGVGAMLSTAGFIIGALVYILGSQMTGLNIATGSGIVLIVVALFPLGAYLFGSFSLISLDVASSLLQLPRKLDRMAGDE